MAHGGKRAGAGRKIGSATKRTREIADKAAAEGITPLEVMLANMRWAFERVKALKLQVNAQPDDEEDVIRFRRLAQEAAKDAAPYMHPKLANLEHSGKDGGALEIKIVRFTDADAN